MARDDDVATGVERRRRYWKKDEKLRIVSESLEEGASAAEVARRYGLNANLLFTWRRQFGAAAAPEPREPAMILPVSISPPIPPATSAPPVEMGGRMEITLSGGEKIVVGSDVQASALARVLKALSRR